jgi:hypothetical protein
VGLVDDDVRGTRQADSRPMSAVEPPVREGRRPGRRFGVDRLPDPGEPRQAVADQLVVEVHVGAEPGNGLDASTPVPAA